MAKETVLRDVADVINSVVARDRCDRCQQETLVIVAKGDWVMSLCGHHGNKIIRLNISQDLGWKIIYDRREWKAEEGVSDSAAPGGAGQLDGSDPGIPLREDVPGWSDEGEADPTPVGS